MRRLALALLLVPAGAAQAAEPMVTSRNPASVVAAAQAAGFEAVATKSPSGFPLVNLKLDGSPWRIHFNDCTDHVDCKALYLDAAFSNPTKVTPQAINAKYYNTVSPRVSLYVNETGELQINAEMNFSGGPVTQAFFVSALKGWVAASSAAVQMVRRP